MLNLGPYTLHSIETGTFALDGGAMFGIVPKTLWEKEIPADSHNRIPMHARALLIQGPGMRMLVDCGMGAKWSEKHREIYQIDQAEDNLVASLARHGLSTQDITHLVFTHLHFDHAGGATQRSLDGSLLPVFPNARMYLQKRNWDLAWKPNEKDRASYLRENFSIFQDEPALKHNLELLTTPTDGEDTLAPGITVEVSDGHTLGMQMVRIADPQQPSNNIVYCADLIPTSSHVRTAYIMGYDCYPVRILEEKKRVLERAADEGSMLFYEHCPNKTASRVTRTQKGDFASTQGVAL